MQITMHRARVAWPAKIKLRMTLDCSRITKEIAMVSGIYIEGRSQTLLYFPSGVDIGKKDRKETESSNKTTRLLSETGRSPATNLETQKQTKRIKIHKSQTVTCLTRASKRVFPKRSPKMID